MMISAQNNTARQNQKAQGQGQGLAAGYAREYIKFDSSGGGERSSFCLPGSQPESILNHQPQNQTQATETREVHEDTLLALAHQEYKAGNYNRALEHCNTVYEKKLGTY
jgi:protein O-GlcNAc transferase